MAEAFDGNTYCNFDATTTKAKAGADVLFAIFDQTGSNLLAVGGQ